MRLPVNYCSTTSNQEHHLVATTAAVSSKSNRRRSSIQFADMSAGTGYDNDKGAHAKAHPDYTPPPASASGNTSATPPDLPNFLHDPVLNRTYARGRFLGKGGFAWCYEVRDTGTHAGFALKVILKSRVVKQIHRNKVLREISIHQSLQHKNIVRFYSAFEDDNNIYMVLELCQLDSLVAVMKQRATLTECEARYYLLQLLAGVQYLHEEARVLHRDLKLGNMLLNEQMQVKIADFGLASLMDLNGCDKFGQVCGTPNYISPEVLRKEGHSRSSEAWAIGCIMYAMLIGKPPFETHSLDKTYSLILSCQYSYPINVRLSASSRDLIGLLLHPNPVNRPTPAQALAHEFFAVAIPVSLPPSCCYSAPNASHLVFYGAGPSSNGGQTTAVVGSTRSVFNDVPSQVVVIRTTTTTCAATHRSSTPLEVFEETNRLGGLGMMRGVSTNTAAVAPLTTYHRISTGSVSGLYSSSSVSNSAHSSNTTSSAYSSVCPFDSFGNVTFGSDRETALTHWLYDMYHALGETLYHPQPYFNGYPQIHVGSNSAIYVTKWIDYSNRYGFGCQFNNGAVSIMQNDRTRLCLSPDRHYCRRWHSNQRSNGCVSGSDVFDLMNPTSAAKESLDAIRHFVDYMDANLVTGGFSATPSSLTLAAPFIVLWRRFSEYLLIVLSDGTFQINFISRHTKVVLSRLVTLPGQHKTDVALTFIDDTRMARTCNLKCAIGSIIDGALLQRVRQLLGDYVLAPTGCFTPEV